MSQGSSKSRPEATVAVDGLVAAAERLALTPGAIQKVLFALKNGGWIVPAEPSQILELNKKTFDTYNRIHKGRAFSHFPNGEAVNNDTTGVARGLKILAHFRSQANSHQHGGHCLTHTDGEFGIVSISQPNAGIERSTAFSAVLQGIDFAYLHTAVTTMIHSITGKAKHRIIGQFTSDSHFVEKNTADHRFLSALSRTGMRDESKQVAFAMIPSSKRIDDSTGFAFFQYSIYERTL